MGSQHIGDLISRRRGGTAIVDEVDVRYGAQRYLQEKLKDKAIKSTAMRGGVLEVVVGGPTIRQEVLLWQYDLGEWLEKEFGYTLDRLSVRFN